MLSKLLILVFVVNYVASSQICSSVSNETKVLETLNGRIRGECFKTPIYHSLEIYKEADVFIWSSIPYAEPPINENRFKKPKPIKPWNSTLDGTVDPNSCLQIGGPNTSEDCLYLNVYVKSETFLNKNKTLKPILVFIHGGSFVSGDVTIYDGRIIAATNDIIVVTVNYRLNALGFLQMADTEVTGNQGLLDQTLAFKWIYDNAKKFGGDNTKITLSGQSAGAFSIGFHLFYPQSWPYFRNGILQSGGPTGKLNVLDLATRQEASASAKLFLGLVNCERNSTNQSIECIMSLNSSDILLAYSNLTTNDRRFIPSIDNIVFSKSIHQLTKENSFKPCNLITGHTSDEWSFYVISDNILGTNPEQRYAQAKAFNYGSFMDLTYLSSPYDIATSDSLLTLYMAGINLTSTDFLNLYVQVASDMVFTCQAYDLAGIYSRRNNKVYTYEFKYRHPLSKIPANLTEFLGSAAHADDLYILFGIFLTNPVASNADKLMSEKMMAYWANFVKYDDPNYLESQNETIWEPFANTSNPIDLVNNGKYILFEKEGIKMASGFSSHNCQYYLSEYLDGNQVTTRAKCATTKRRCTKKTTKRVNC